jgi:hypothetical protein
MLRLYRLDITPVSLPHADGARETRLMFESTKVMIKGATDLDFH